MENLRIELEKEKQFMIFGAGETDWLKLRNEIIRTGNTISCYVVSRKERNPDNLNNVPVKVIDEITEEEKKKSIVISNALAKQEEIARLLEREGFQTILYGIRRYSSLTKREKADIANCGWKINMDISMLEMTKEHVVKEKDIKIYVVTSHLNLHHAKQNFISDILCYIQAGSALTEVEICELKDNTGDHISERNKFFCELTAGYWIYKNDNQHKYVGLYHYSRAFDLDEEKILYILNSGVSVILSEPLVCFSRRKNFWENEEQIRQSIIALFPDYIETYNGYIEKGLFIPSNMIIATKEIYDQYYKWLFDIFCEYEKILEKQNQKIIPRSMGYLAEELTGVFFLHHSKEWNIFYAKQKEMY